MCSIFRRGVRSCTLPRPARTGRNAPPHHRGGALPRSCLACLAAAFLGRARERFSDGLNSFVHGGIQPFARHQAGYPIGLLMDVLKNPNAMGMLTLHVLSALPQQGEAVALVQTLYAEFDDMLPTLEPLPFPTGTP